MNRILHFSFFALALLFLQDLNAQDQPDGFASVAGKGLTTTIGGEGGQVIIVDADNKRGLNYISSSQPYIIIIKGTIEPSAWREITVGSNTTIVGYGVDATLKNYELHIDGKENIIIRNLTIRDSYVEGDWDGKDNDNDAVQADNSHHIWIDHCHFARCGDGLIDLRKVCDYVTVSYTKLSHHNKTFGLGWTEETDWRTTIHHCWIDSTNQRNPSFDMGIGHLYNNYLSRIFSYGNLSRGEARVIVQNSVFENASDPLKISDNALLYSSGNEFINCTGSRNGNTSNMPYDLDSYYSYTLDPTDQVKEIVTAEAGPQQYISDQYNTTSIGETLASKNRILYTIDNKNNMLSLQSEEPEYVKVSLFSYDGRKLFTKELDVTNRSSISLNDQKTGVYILRFEMADKIETAKIFLN